MDAVAIDDLTLEAVRRWWLFVVAGVLWIVFAWVVLSFNYRTVWAVAVMFGLGLLAGGLVGIAIGLSAPSWRWLHVSFGVIGVVGGIVALAWPDATFLVLAVIIGWYIMFSGLLDIATAFATKGEHEFWWLHLALGIAQVLIGFWAVGYPGRSISLLVVWVGATALARGISGLLLGFGLYGAGRELRRRMA